MSAPTGSGPAGWHARLAAALAVHRPADPAEAADLERLRALARLADPWARAEPCHLTSSALAVHPPTRRVLLRWHEHLGRFLHVGGHGEPGEEDPAAVALREAVEETGLSDLAHFPGPAPCLLQVAVVQVPPRRSEPVGHQHADLRYLLATATPELAVPERPTAVLRWVPLEEAIEEVAPDRLALALRLAARLLPGA